jgi:glycosyltransferase involved in cell wall biosynthesis
VPAGWLRFRVRLRRLDNEAHHHNQAWLLADFGEGRERATCLERFFWSGVLSDAVYLFLERPARALYFRPFERSGSFAIEDFAVQPVPRWRAAFDALGRKVRLLRAYQCTGRVLWRGLGMLLRGRFTEIRGKIFKGLADARLLRPETDFGLEALALGRRELSDQERKRLETEANVLADPPTLSVLLPVDDTPEGTLILALASLRRQVYRHWHLVAALTASTGLGPRRLLERHAADDPRVSVVTGPPGGNLETACATAIATIKDPFIAHLHPGYELTETALLRVARRLLQEPLVDRLVNSPPPEDDADDGGSAIYRPREQALNVVRTDAVLCRRIFNTAYLPEPLTRPATLLTPLVIDPAPAQAVDSGVGHRHPLLLTGNILGVSAYDRVVVELAQGLLSLGIDVRISAESRLRRDLLSDRLAALVRPRLPGDHDLVIAPPHLLAQAAPPPGAAILTMWESDRLDPAWVPILNKAAVVLVPSRWGVESFRASGVTAPMVRVPLGYDPLTFHPDGSHPPVCTFGAAGALAGGGFRKNLAHLIDLFERAFPDEPDVRLRLKVTPRCHLSEPNDPRVEVLHRLLRPAELTDWYRSLTVYVNTSSAEGFGLHLVEAMACGVPLVSTMFGGVAEYFDAAVGYPVPYRLVPADGLVYRGSWAEADETALIAALRAIYQAPAAAARLGARAAARALRFTWKQSGRRLLAVLAEHGIAVSRITPIPDGPDGRGSVEVLAQGRFP